MGKELKFNKVSSLPAASAALAGNIYFNETDRTINICTGTGYSTYNGNNTWRPLGTGAEQAAAGNHTHTFASLTSKPTTLSGYGITDAAALNHSHSYLPLSGGTMSNTNVVTNLNADLLDGYHHSSFAKVASTNNLISSNNEFNFVPSAYAGEVHINYRTTGGANGAITKYNFDNGAGGALATISQGQFSGNAASSSKWANARTITLTGSVTGSVSIDGSQNVSLATTTNHTHTKSQITDFPSSLPASDVYAWAKASAKPTYNATEVKLSGYSNPGSYSAIAAGDTVQAAIGKLEGALSGLETLLASI